MVYYVIAFAAGLGITLQTTLNSQLAKGLAGDAVTAALFSFTAGAVSLGIYALLRGGLATSLSAIPSQPLWSLTGGFMVPARCSAMSCWHENWFFRPARAGDCRAVALVAGD